MRKRQKIYPIFLAQAGCPYQCIYCNQQKVTPHSRCFDVYTQFQSQFEVMVEQVERSGYPGELAFYGGTFTALPRQVLKEILDAATHQVHQGRFSGIRFSTRPDCLALSLCDFLAGYPISTVELGVQSLCSDVLSSSGRNYSSADVARSCLRIHERNWALGIQLMLGLPNDTRQRFLQAVQGAILLRPQVVRLYPTLVLQNTVLAQWHAAGRYHPLSLEQAVDWCVPAYDAFLEAGITVARMGLQADRELERPGTILAGPYHAAFGQLVRSAWWRNRIDQLLCRKGDFGQSRKLTIHVASPELSDVLGCRRYNIAYWRDKWRFEEVEVQGVSDRSPRQFELALH